MAASSRKDDQQAPLCRPPISSVSCTPAGELLRAVQLSLRSTTLLAGQHLAFELQIVIGVAVYAWLHSTASDLPWRAWPQHTNIQPSCRWKLQHRVPSSKLHSVNTWAASAGMDRTSRQCYRTTYLLLQAACLQQRQASCTWCS